jgi:hypothetical protein
VGVFFNRIYRIDKIERIIQGEAFFYPVDPVHPVRINLRLSSP